MRSRRTKTENTNLVYHRSMSKSLSKGRNCNKICMVKNTVCSRQGTRTYNRMYECEPHQVHLMVNCEDCNKSTLRAILHSSMTLYSAHVYQSLRAIILTPSHRPACLVSRIYFNAFLLSVSVCSSSITVARNEFVNHFFALRMSSIRIFITKY